MIQNQKSRLLTTRNRTLLAILSLLLTLPFVSARAFAAEDDPDALLQQAVTASRQGDQPKALGLATRAIKTDPKQTSGWLVRAQIYDRQREHAKAIADYSEVLKLDPKASAVWQRRGEVHFRQGKMREAVADFDRFLSLVPDQKPHHWQRGIALYYAGRFAEGKQQFELHQTVNTQDVENAVWHFLCTARAESLESAKQKLIPITGDPRIPMAQVHQLFAGKAKPEDVLAAAQAASKNTPAGEPLFYAHLYLGLYYEATGDAEKTRAHILKAAERAKENGYMGDVALVHAAQLKAPRKPAKGLLIIAPKAFHPALTDYVRHKKAQMEVKLVALETALAASKGVDDAERLKRFLYETWRREKTGYVLLVGDADVLPVRYMVLDRVTPAAFDYAFYPSDLYYSDLAKPDGSFEDWNAQKEGFHADYFGEVRGEKNKEDSINYDRVDYRPDAAVGRWPVSTPEEVKIVAAKTMAYENGLARGDKAGARNAALFAVGGWVDMRGQMETNANTLAQHWNVAKYFYADKARDDKTPPPNEPNLLAVLNAGVGLVLHAGHGNDDVWEGCCNVKNLPQVKNADRLPIMVSAGCSTARFATLPPYEPYVDVNGKEHKGTNNGEVFTEPPPPPACYQKDRYNLTGLGEQLLRRGADGAVAYIGCNTGSQPCGLTLMEGFVQAVAQDREPRLGDCWAQAVAHYFKKEGLASIVPTNDWYPASIFFQGMKFMVFGDPSLQMDAKSSEGREN